jgi:hypothetical protein
VWRVEKGVGWEQGVESGEGCRVGAGVWRVEKGVGWEQGMESGDTG